MKKIITLSAIFLSFSALCQNWDREYETAKYEFQNNITKTFYTEVSNSSLAFSYDDYLAIENACIEENNFFRLEFESETNTIRFYHKSNVDGHFIKTFLESNLGLENYVMEEMQLYLFD